MGSNNARNENQTLASSIQAQLHHQSPLRVNHSIFRIPDVLRNGNEKVYVPYLVSIGPFHRGLNLQTMEGIKLWYLHCLLKRNPTPNTGLELFVEAIRGIEQDCRNCYEDQIDLSSDEFVQMMVVDGCFIIEFFRKFSRQVPIEYEDPLFHKSWMCERVRNDLLLLENQLPWRVLNFLFDLTQERGPVNSPLSLPLRELVIQCHKEYTLGMCPLAANGALESLHLIDLIRNSLLGSYAQRQFEPLISWSRIPCATELADAGILFECGRKEDMLNIDFKNGVMRIPPVTVDRNGESVYRNLIAYEQCGPNSMSKITSYAVLLGDLIKSAEDVEFLIRRGIIEDTAIGDLASLLNSLTTDVRVYNFSYAKLYEKVNKYRKRPWHEWRAILIKQYFRDPWSVINLTFPIITVTTLTMVQTLYSIMSYNKQFEK